MTQKFLNQIACFFVLLYSAASYAQDCPHLAGKYFCGDQTYNYGLVIQEQVSNGVTIYNFKWSKGFPEVATYIADGKERSVGDFPDEIQDSTDTCKNNQLIHNEADTDFVSCGVTGYGSCAETTTSYEIYSLQGTDLIYNDNGSPGLMVCHPTR